MATDVLNVLNVTLFGILCVVPGVIMLSFYHDEAPPSSTMLQLGINL